MRPLCGPTHNYLEILFVTKTQPTWLKSDSYKGCITPGGNIMNDWHALCNRKAMWPSNVGHFSEAPNNSPLDHPLEFPAKMLPLHDPGYQDAYWENLILNLGAG